MKEATPPKGKQQTAKTNKSQPNLAAMGLKNNWSNPTLACQRADKHEQKRKQKMAKPCKKGVSEKPTGQAKPLAFQRSCPENRAEAPPAPRQKQTKGWGRTTSTTGKQEGQTGLQEEGGADRQPEDQREGGEGKTDNTARGGGTDNRAGGGRTTSTTGKQEGQTGLQEAGGADRQPEDQREEGEEGTDNTTRGGAPDNQAGGMEDRRPNKTRGLGTRLAARGLGGCWFFVFVWL